MKDPTQDYLRETLEMNPRWQSGEILLRRRKFLNLEEKPATVDRLRRTESIPRSADGRLQLTAVQSRFYQMTDDELNVALDALASPRYPELASTIVRLRAVAVQRDTIAALYEDTGVDRDLIHAFGTSLVLAPADAGYVRERYIQSLTSRRKLRFAQQTVERIQRDFPSLFELQRDWLTTILIQRKASGNSFERSVSPAFNLSLGLILVIVLAVVAKVLRLAEVFQDSN